MSEWLEKIIDKNNPGWRERHEQREKLIAERAQEIFQEHCAEVRGSHLEETFRAACLKLARAERLSNEYPYESSWGFDTITARCAWHDLLDAKIELNALLKEHAEYLRFLEEPLKLGAADRDCWGSVCPDCKYRNKSHKPCAVCRG